MTETSQRVLIVEHDDDLARLLHEVLTDEGYQAEWILASPESVGEIRRRQPDVLIVNVAPGWNNEYDLLDTLRADSVGQRIPVLVITTSELLANGALASYNVRETLVKPLDLEDFLAKVAQALGQPPLQAEIPPGVGVSGVQARAEDILTEYSRDLLMRWMQRLNWESYWEGRRDLGFQGVLDNAPVIVEALTAALSYGNPATFFERHPEAIDRVRQHTWARRSQDVPLSVLVREYSLLRDELWGMLGRQLPAEISTSDVLLLERAINRTFDRVVELTIPAYVEPSTTATV
ncbi:MAG TPA: response regulator [Chloroflexota bacterium]|nr:response regulator [Chloroflexota bacterium]